ncbi:hypothetical protein [Pseudaeromonas paramecii]|uniref:Uncharacterized protein n=1 Tax=Pseudaeromonas paramecii TaxID=2138166 RepID=A0ABP8QDR4_9GAMM
MDLLLLLALLLFFISALLSVVMVSRLKIALKNHSQSELQKFGLDTTSQLSFKSGIRNKRKAEGFIFGGYKNHPDPTIAKLGKQVFIVTLVFYTSILLFAILAFVGRST